MAYDPDLYTVTVHAAAAVRRKTDALAALAAHKKSDDPQDAERAIGDASHAVISLFLAADAALRFCKRKDEPGPLGRQRLEAVLLSATHLRDAVMHWDDKGQREPETSLFVEGRGIVAYAPPGRKSDTPPTADGFTWVEFERDATRLGRWASYQLRQPDEVP